MKKTAKITALFTAFGMALVSCVREPSPVDGFKEGLPVTIALGASSSGRTEAGDQADRVINSLRVLVYNSSNNASTPGKLISNIPITHDENYDPIVFPKNPLTTKLNVLTGTYDFVFIANETSDSSVSAILDGLDPDDSSNNSIVKLNGIEFDAAAFHRSKSIPMVTVVRGVKVYGDEDVDVPGIGRITAGGGAPHFGVWPVELERIGVRLDVNLSLTTSQYNSIGSGDELELMGMPSGAWLLPHNESNFSTTAPAGNSNIDKNTGFAPDPDVTGNYIKKFTFILPERILWAGDNVKGNAMTITALGKSGKVHWLNDDDSPNYLLHRNLYLDLTATVLEDKIEFKNIKIIDWVEKEIRLTDRGVVIPQAGVHAPPGVLGVNSRTGRLTLCGSSEYAGTEVEANSEFGSLEADPVYVALFKWGSLVATGSDPAKKTFDNSDIIWAPDEYNVTKLLKDIGKPADNIAQAAAWGEVPYVSQYGNEKYVIPETNAVEGIGDPCGFADKGAVTGRYIMPKAPGNNWNNGTFVIGGSSAAYWIGQDDLKTGLPAGIHTDDWSIFLPVTGSRNEMRGGSEYNSSDERGGGNYWANKAIGDDDGPVGSYRLHFDTSITSAHRNVENAFAIRCVRELTLPRKGMLAPPGVLGVGEETGQLTLRGSKEFRNDAYIKSIADAEFGEFGGLADERVFVALFKWGSLLATTSIGFTWTDKTTWDGEFDKFDPTDIMWAPEEYDYEKLVEDVQGASGTAAKWQLITRGTDRVFPANSATAGLGDPCTYADGAKGNGAWRVPDSDYNIGTLGLYTPQGIDEDEIIDLDYNDIDELEGMKNNTGTLFLSAAGYRNHVTTGEGQGEERGESGYYMSKRTTQNDDARLQGLVFHKSGTVNSEFNTEVSKDRAIAIRCVK